MRGFDIAVALALLLLAAYEATVAFLLWRSARERGRPLGGERWMWIRAFLSVVLASAAVGALFSLSGTYIAVVGAGAMIGFGALVLLLFLDIARGIFQTINRKGRKRTSQTSIEVDVASQATSVEQPILGTDPGWRDAVPIVGTIRLARNGETLDTRPLVGLRLAFVGAAASPVMFLIALMYIAPWQGPKPVVAWLPAILVVQGIGSIALILRRRDRPLESDSAGSLVADYRSAMFTGIGIAESTAGVAFIMTIIASSLWLYVVGLALSLIGLVLVAPTTGDIRRRQKQLETARVPISLLQALNTPARWRPA
jgi:hypothetical protein